MRKVFISLVMSVIVGSCFAPLAAFAVTVQYGMNPDDYASLYINGSHVMTFDNGGSGTVSGAVTLPEGWYSITLDYKNRWGTDALGFWWNAGEGSNPFSSLVPEAHFRSQDSSGLWISGLRADYYWLNSDSTRGAFIQTIYGEGPIAHGNQSYEGWNNGRSWPTVGYSGKFEEILTGEIFVGNSPPSPTPEPATMLLLVSGLIGLLGLRRKWIRG